MTYALSWPLQEALFDTLCKHPVCADFFEHRIFDAPPPFGNEATPEGLYLTLGDEEANDWSTGSDGGAVHTIKLAVHAPRRGFAEAKQAAAAVCDAILGGEFALTRGRVVNTRFVDAKTKREEADALRRIDLRFRITVEDTVQ